MIWSDRALLIGAALGVVGVSAMLLPVLIPPVLVSHTASASLSGETIASVVQGASSANLDAGVDGPAPALLATPRPDPAWVARIAAATGIPDRALQAYAAAQLATTAENPACGLGWNTLAAIGSIESDHGRHGGAVLGADGVSLPAIRGAALDGNGVAAIADTDGGAWDGDAVWDRAVGPLQFIPDTWQRWGADGNGDGVADPNQIDDAALAAARYLCASGPVTDPVQWRAAVFSYNHLDVYVDDVAHVASRYAGASSP